MPKRILEDIKPLSRTGSQTASHPVLPPKHIPFHPPSQKPTAKRTLWYLALLAIVILIFSLSFLFEKATISITPKSVPVALDSADVFTALKDTVVAGSIVYTEMTLTGDQTVTIPATETKTLSESARGSVILYNTFSTTPYRLAVNTRLETPDGRTYRISTAVSIPGYKQVGTTVTPGSIEVTVVASEPGEASNIERADFTFPGLKNTPQYSKIYARTKTAISGGVTGTMYVIPEGSAEAAFDTLKEKLRASLITKAKVQVPDGYLFYEGATVFTPGLTANVSYSKEPNVPIVLTGALTAYLIKEDTLISAMAKRFVSQYSGEDVHVPHLRDLAVTINSDAKNLNNGILTFSFNGDTPIVWDVDTSTVVSMLAGNKKSDFNSLLSEIVGIDSAVTVIKPFWKQSFPKESKRIFVSVETIQ
jgi:hypothetical protein